MDFETRHKILEENLFADMVVMVGRYMEYTTENSTWDEEDFVQYYEKRNNSIVGRCIVQANVIRQAQRYYEGKREDRDIRYCRVRRSFRKNNKMPFYCLDYEQFYFWKYVMDFIINDQKGLLDVVVKEVIRNCDYYSPNENEVAPYADCLQKILGWYYIGLKMGTGIRHKKIANDMLEMFRQYSNFPEFKRNCRTYMEMNENT